MKRLFFLLTAATAITFSACTKDKDDVNTLNDTDKSFMTQAAYSNNAEVAAGALAASKSGNTEISNFGQMMVTDHTEAQTELSSLATSVSVTLPDGMDDAHIALINDLTINTGVEFDTLYISSQIKDHQEAITLFQNEINNGSNTRVKAYAQKYLPKLQAHLQSAIDAKTSILIP